MFNVTYNSKTPANFNCWLATIPVLTPSEIVRTVQTVPMMDGDLLVGDESRSDAYWDFTIHGKRDDLTTKMRQVRQWLSGEGVLTFSDATDAYYEVKECKYTQIMKKDEKYGRVAVQMRVYPYEFLMSGDTDITSYSTIANSADTSKPLYKIVGSGSGVLTVNGHQMSYTVSGTLYIDTRRKIAYDGSGNGKDSVINGDYEGLYLKSGNNSITCTAGTLTVKPKWGYKI